MLWEKLLELLVTAGATLGAAYWGARAAFQFNLKHHADNVRAQQIEECNRALLVLTHQYNWLLNYQHQHLEPWRESEARHLSLPPSELMDYKGWTVNIPALAFLSQTAAGELPFMLGLVEGKFHGVIAAINMRSEVHREFQKTLSASGLDLNAAAALVDIEAAIGPRIAITLRRGTDQIEPPRILRRLHSLRGLSHEEVEQVFTRGARARRAHGAGTPQRVPVVVGCH